MKLKILTEEELLIKWRDFNDAEKTVAGLTITRLHEGQGQYGKWHPGDGRDKLVEAIYEFIDVPNYMAMKLIEMVKFWEREE